MNTTLDPNVKDAIASFVLDSTNFPQLEADDALFESGIVNSLFAVQLMTFLEKTFGIEITSDDLDIQNFRSINATAAFVINKRTAVAA